jgi:hypothetical protein
MLKVVPRDCIPQDKSSKGKWKRCFIKFQKLLKLRKSINIFIPFQNCNFSCSCNKLTKKTITFETIFRHVARVFYLNLNIFSEFLQYLFDFSEKRFFRILNLKCFFHLFLYLKPKLLNNHLRYFITFIV